MSEIRTSAPIHMMIQMPETEEGKLALARKVAEIHAELIFGCIRKLDCPVEQKNRLLDAVITAVRNESSFTR